MRNRMIAMLLAAALAGTMLAGCGGSGTNSASAGENSEAGEAASAEGSDYAEDVAEDAAQTFDGLTEETERVTGDYSDTDTFLRDAMLAVGGIDLDTLEHKDEIKSYDYEPGQNEEGETDHWYLSMQGEDTLSPEFCEEIDQLVRDSYPDGSISMITTVDGEDEENDIHYTQDVSGVTVSVKYYFAASSSETYTISFEATTDFIDATQDTWVACSTDNNYNLESSYDILSSDAAYKIVALPEADSAEMQFIDGLLLDVFGISLGDLTCGEEIRSYSCNAYSTYGSEDAYVNDWTVELSSHDHNQKPGMNIRWDGFTDACVLELKDLFEANMDEAMREKTRNDGQVQLYEGSYTTNDGRINVEVSIANDYGGSRTQTVTNLGTVEVNANPEGVVTLHAEVSDDYYEQFYY